jgi:hypothetical protein
MHLDLHHIKSKHIAKAVHVCKNLNHLQNIRSTILLYDEFTYMAK